jgi:hypothetical protein
MSKEIQIEEMARELNTATFGVNVHTLADHLKPETINKVAEYLYNAGYRKQGWISVDERLPKVDTDVLVITANGSFKVGRCNIYHNGTLVLWMTNDGLGEKAITHWMPLPEAPKMKGGGE